MKFKFLYFSLSFITYSTVSGNSIPVLLKKTVKLLNSSIARPKTAKLSFPPENATATGSLNFSATLLIKFLASLTFFSNSAEFALITSLMVAFLPFNRFPLPLLFLFILTPVPLAWGLINSL
ncbi:121aa long hypothetical protein [Pyrococcus horikoshii OT3]|uniref:Uncharacterized protein n=1 Tax=Pyrococcus horikoshii (strain ATCC 700860 / DSM 12428 / JCM 9974 / NBRC 100139 / OT-3) TaxID=70601 RepID=O58007_PYRHO|nr:121aa long hypothetical protein [Pyrococcus horikoshii OT3]